MNRWRCGSFLLILAVGCTTAEIVKNAQEELIPDNVATATNVEQRQTRDAQADSDYENALRPALLQKRSIANIARLLLGGNVPPNHPLVKYPEPKAWNLASNIVASLPASSQLNTAASSTNQGWAQPNNALQNIQQLFQTKAKIIPYTGQVATGLTGLATVKGDLLRQIHSISTQAIAQAAAEAAARALASAAAAHAVTNSIHNAVNPGAQTGIKGGWSSYQNMYANAPDKPGPGDQPGPPYHSSSAHINHYQAPPSPYNPYQMPATTPSPLATLPSPYQNQGQNQQYQNQNQNQNNGYYTLYNTQPAGQTPYTPAPPVGHARPTLSPNTLIATTPSGYSPSLSKPLAATPTQLPVNGSDDDEGSIDRMGRSFFRLPKPVIVVSTGSNNAPLTSFRRTVPAGIFGRHAPQSSSTTSLLSTISSLLSASTAAYNAAFTGGSPHGHGNGHGPGHQQQASAVFSNLLSAASSPYSSGAQAVHSPASAGGSSPSSSAAILSAAADASGFHNGYGQQSANSLSHGGGHYGSPAGSSIPSYVHQTVPATPGAYGSGQTSSAPVHPSSYSFNQHAASNVGASYAQPGTYPYASQPVQQSSPQFGVGAGGPPSPATNYASGSNSYISGIISNGFPNGAGQVPGSGSGYTGYNGGAGSSSGHVGGWNTQSSGSSPSASSWPASSPNVYPPGYAGQTSGNFNNPSGGFGGAAQAAQYPVASGSTIPQQNYPTISQNAYQSPTPNAYAQTQSLPPPPQYSSSYQQQQQQSPSSLLYGAGGIGNTNLNSRFDPQDLSQSASTMGNNDYESEEDSHIPSQHQSNHHSYQQAQRRNRRPPAKNSYTSPRYPSPAKKRPASTPKKPSQLYNSHARLKHNFRNSNNGGQDKRVIPTGNRKGSYFDSSSSSSLVDVVDDVDAHVDDDIIEPENFYQSQEYPHDKNRWRTKNTSGQRPNSFHNHDSNGRWGGEETLPKQAAPANVRGNGPKRVRPQSGQSKGASQNHRDQKVPHPNSKSKPKSNPAKESWRQKQQHQQKQRPKTKTQAADIYGGRLEQKQQQSGTVYKSRDVYTTLPEYVFRKGERIDVFLRPSRKRKHGGSRRGILRPRVGETIGSGGDGGDDSSSGSSKTEEGLTSPHSQTVSSSSYPKRKNFAPASYPYEEETGVISSSSEEMERAETASAIPFKTTGTFLKSATNTGEDEEFVGSSEAVDETARADVLSPNNDFITASEEFDPEEREAFVDDVYAGEDHHSHHQVHHHPPHRRQDLYGGEEGDGEDQEDTEQEGVEEDLIDKK